MPCFNAGIYLEKAVRSILSQTYMDFELLIVDDFSTDNSRHIAENFSKFDRRVVSLENTKTKGIAGAFNSALALAKGQYITRMDSDDISCRERLEKQVAFLDCNKGYDICSVNLCLINKHGFSVSGPLFKRTTTPLEWLFLWKNPIANAPAMVRKSAIDRCGVGCCDYIVAEDYDFLSRVALQGKVFQLDEVLYKYRRQESGTFLKNKEQAIVNSVEIAGNLAGDLVGCEGGHLHKFLTDFCGCQGQSLPVQELPALLEYSAKLLAAAQKNWGWNDEEYRYAQRDMLQRILRLFERDINESSYLKRLKDFLNNKKSMVFLLVADLRDVVRGFRVH